MPKFTVNATNNAPVDGTNATYSACVTGLVGVAGDVLIINPSAASQSTGVQSQKVVKVTRVAFSGTATATTPVVVTLVMRSTADTAGTTVTAVPHDSRDGPATAVVQSYTAAPTPGTTIGTIRSVTIDAGNLTTPITSAVQVWDFGNGPKKCPALWQAAQGLAVNVGSTVAGALYDIEIEWAEETFS